MQEDSLSIRAVRRRYWAARQKETADALREAKKRHAPETTALVALNHATQRQDRAAMAKAADVIVALTYCVPPAFMGYFPKTGEVRFPGEPLPPQGKSILWELRLYDAQLTR